MAKRNFLLGKGELLTEYVRGVNSPVNKSAPYTFSEAKRRLQPMITNTVAKIKNLPADACPDDLAVATITLNPEYIAKTYYPSELLRSAGLETVGSRARHLTPEKKSKDRDPQESFTTELFVKGKRKSFRQWAESFQNLNEVSPGALQIQGIEEISFAAADEKIKNIDFNSDKAVFEVVLHLGEESGEHYLEMFKKYLAKRNIKATFNKRFYAGGLCFLELEASNNRTEYIAEFSLVRVVRTMPSLRLLRPAIRTGGVDKSLKIKIPRYAPLDPNIKVAIFDGGIPSGHPIRRWARVFDAQGVGASVPELLEHGVGVTFILIWTH